MRNLMKESYCIKNKIGEHGIKWRPEKYRIEIWDMRE